MLKRHRNQNPEHYTQPSEQEVFDRVTKDVLEKADAFTIGTEPRATVLQIDNINRHQPVGKGGDIHAVSPEHTAALIETLYAGFGAEAPAEDLTKWTYNAERTQHVAVTPTEFGFDIVETRFRLEETDPARLPAPQSCGYYTLELARPSH